MLLLVKISLPFDHRRAFGSIEYLTLFLGSDKPIFNILVEYFESKFLFVSKCEYLKKHVNNNYHYFIRVLIEIYNFETIGILFCLNRD